MKLLLSFIFLLSTSLVSSNAGAFSLFKECSYSGKKGSSVKMSCKKGNKGKKLKKKKLLKNLTQYCQNTGGTKISNIKYDSCNKKFTKCSKAKAKCK